MTLNAMPSFLTSHMRTIAENIRLLESLITAPSELCSEVKMLRESLHLPATAGHPVENIQAPSADFMRGTSSPIELALNTIASINISIGILGRTDLAPNTPRLEARWLVQAQQVLEQAEMSLSSEIRASTASLIQGIYVIVDPEVTRGRPVLEIAESTLKGGASIVQLRDKTHNKGDILPIAHQLKSLCDQYHALLIVNDDADLAVTSNAHGLHLGQTDLPMTEARRVIGPLQIIGRSNNSIEDAIAPEAQEADYLAIGALYATTTMGKTTRPIVGVDTVRKIKDIVSQPLVAIGGINPTNVKDVVRAGVDCVCVVSSVTMADNPETATRALLYAMESALTNQSV